MAEEAARDSARPQPETPTTPTPEQPTPEQPTKAPEAAASQPANGNAAATPEAYGNRYDFIPGDKVLVFDDFSDTDVGEYPARWTVKDGVEATRSRSSRSAAAGS